MPTSILMCLRTMLKPISLSLSRSHLKVQVQERVQVQVQVKVQVREQGQVQVQLHLPTQTPDSLLRWRGEQPVRPVALVQGAHLGNIRFTLTSTFSSTIPPHLEVQQLPVELDPVGLAPPPQPDRPQTTVGGDQVTRGQPHLRLVCTCTGTSLTLSV